MKRLILRADEAAVFHREGRVEVSQPVRLWTLAADCAWAPDWIERAIVDPGGTIFGPGPYLKVPIQWQRLDGAGLDEGHIRVHSPFGSPGEVRWVAEAWASSVGLDNRRPTEFNRPDCTTTMGWPYWYAADGALRWTGAEAGGPAFTTRGKWRSAALMPQWASRAQTTLNAQRVTLDSGVWRWRADAVRLETT